MTKVDHLVAELIRLKILNNDPVVYREIKDAFNDILEGVDTLHWYALNYRTASSENAEYEWKELQKFVTRSEIIKELYLKIIHTS